MVSPAVNTAIEAIEMQQWLRAAFRRHLPEIEKESAVFERSIGCDTPTEANVAGIRLCAALIAQAEIVMWREDIFRAAISGFKSFVGYQFESDFLLPDGKNPTAPQLWFLCGGQWTTRDGYATTAQIMFVGISTETKKPMLGQLAILQPYAPMAQPSGEARFPAVDYTSWDINCPIDEDGWAQTIAAIQFMRQPIVAKERLEVPRQYRRLHERHHEEPLRSVYTIRLRHQLGSTRGGAADGREYRCQWLVGAHWRNQFYPSEGRHKPVYILPYVKGDPSKPFKSPGEKVYAVVR